jgi:hypothetical protein
LGSLVMPITQTLGLLTIFSISALISSSFIIAHKKLLRHLTA